MLASIDIYEAIVTVSRMAYVRMIDEEEAEGLLADVYAQVRARWNFVPEAARIFSLRPELAQAVDNMRSVLLGDNNSLGARKADLIGGAISGMNHCQLCGTAHAGLLWDRKDLREDEALQIYKDWRKVDLPEDEKAMLRFAEKLTFTPSQVTEEDVQELRDVGFSEVNILDIVTLAAYRNFMNRINDGLGVEFDTLRTRFNDSWVDKVVEATRL